MPELVLQLALGILEEDRRGLPPVAQSNVSQTQNHLSIILRKKIKTFSFG
jgi:hypothetical protein